jgi:hypothetical protein
MTGDAEFPPDSCHLWTRFDVVRMFGLYGVRLARRIGRSDWHLPNWRR